MSEPIMGGVNNRGEADESVPELMQDRLRRSTVSIAEVEEADTSVPELMQDRLMRSTVSIADVEGWILLLDKSKCKEYDEFIELNYSDKASFLPCGLLNDKNNCFVNVVLQCLTFSRPLAAYVLKKMHKKECRCDVDVVVWCFLCEFQAHVEKTKESPEPFLPNKILLHLSKIDDKLCLGRQEDAHEFMRSSISRMLVAEPNLIESIFLGQLESQLTCKQCNNVSKKLENMMDLVLQIEDAASLEECLAQFTAEENLDGDNKYKCDGCNKRVEALKRLRIGQAPSILMVVLNRCQTTSIHNLEKRVMFPEMLDLIPYISEVDVTAMYKLYAVVVHKNILNDSNSGHYICYIKDFNGNWYIVDDSKVEGVKLDKVLSETAYMLLYNREQLDASDLASTQIQVPAFSTPTLLSENCFSKPTLPLYADMSKFKEYDECIEGSHLASTQIQLPPFSTPLPLLLIRRSDIKTPISVTERMAGSREITSRYRGAVSNRFDRKFAYNNFSLYKKHVNSGDTLRSMAFLDNSNCIALGSVSGTVKIQNLEHDSILERYSGNNYSTILVQFSSNGHMILVSSSREVRFWRPYTNERVRLLKRQKGARFNNKGKQFATAQIGRTAQPKILLYNIEEFKEEWGLICNNLSSCLKGVQYSPIHFSIKDDDRLLLWNGTVWDVRQPKLVHCFDDLTDYGGGGFHPTRNQLIINSDVFYMRKFEVIQTVPGLDKTLLTFNAHGDVIYAKPRSKAHPLCSGFLTVDGLNYREISTTSVNARVYDFAIDATESLVGLITWDNYFQESAVQIYQVGRKTESERAGDDDDVDK